MQPTLGRFISLINMTAAARIQCLRQIRGIAEDLQQHRLMAHVDRAIACDRKAVELNARWRLSHWRGQSEPYFARLDARLSRVLTDIFDNAVAHISGDVVGENLRRAAENILVTVFPFGVSAILTLPYVERQFALERIIDLLVSDLASDTEALDMSRSIVELCTVADRYRSELAERAETRMFAPVAEARERGQDRLFEVVAMILATFAGSDGYSHAQARAELLAPFMVEDSAARAQVRRSNGRAVEAA